MGALSWHSCFLRKPLRRSRTIGTRCRQRRLGHVALLSTAWILPPQLCPSRGKKELARQRRSQKSIVREVNFPAARRGMPVGRCRDDDGDSDGGIPLLIGVHYLIVGCSIVRRQLRPAPTPLPLTLCVLLPPSQIRAPSRRRTRPPTARPQS